MPKLARRLPGFRFEVQAPPLPEVLPRMDIAAFVGFAASGPLHTPVAVEDPAQFAAIFGNDAPLAWDVQRGEQVYAYLGPAVRAFFANGGRRAWIVRVADKQKAHANYFPVPGLVQAALDDTGQIRALRPAFAAARAAGSWSDSWQVSATLISQSLKLSSLAFSSSEVTAEIEPVSNLVLQQGDLLRFSFLAENLILLLKIGEVAPTEQRRIRLIGSLQNWFEQVKNIAVGETPPVFSFAPGSDTPVLLPNAGAARLNLQTNRVTLPLNLPLSNAPALASLLRLDLAGGQSWLAVEQVRGLTPTSVEVTGPTLRWLNTGPVILPDALPANLEVERLSFELWARQGEDNPVRLSDLTFAAEHPRFWAALPADESLYGAAESEEARRYSEIWQEARSPRFPLAGSNGSFFLPLFLAGLPQAFANPFPSTASALERDGLKIFSESLFVDPALAGLGTTDLLALADFLRYQNLNPRPLEGMHSLLALEEITLLALPDAVQRGWSSFSPPPQAPARPSQPLPHPDWSHCLSPEPQTNTAKPDWSNFLDCALLEIPSPINLRSDSPDASGTFRLQWDEVALPGVIYILEEATRPDWADAEVIYTGKAAAYTLYSRTPGDHYYRVRATFGESTSEWSEGLPVRVTPANQWQLETEQNYRPEILLAVQRAALRMCAARGDLVVVLSLPEHFREAQTLQYLAALRLMSGPEAVSTSVFSLGYGETNTLSYGALYHPWLINRSNGLLQRTPPDGAACGLMAKRAVERGAWVAPANEILPGVVALTPPFAESFRLDLQEARLNLVRQEPRGFTVLNADTLSLEEDLRPINVRRLLILLRRLALKLGATYVFEPNDASLERLVQGGFEAMLEQLFARGAFAGATPAAAFQVITSPLNTSQGRFIVEIRVAPALPLTFLTLRLVQADDRGTVTEVL